MQRYFIVSGIMFACVTIAWITRLALAIPIQVGTFAVPGWISIIPIVITGSLAFWGLRLAGTAPRA